MLLTADVGNTNIKLGIFDGDTLRYKLRFATNDKMTSDEFAVELYTFFQIYGIEYEKIDGSIISSVVPKITAPLSGGDIVCGCVGAFGKYGGPLIVIFMGTATVIAYVDERCAYRGGIIAPGVGISLDALTSRGALLPAVDLQAPQKAICTNTVDCIRSGVVNGTACMLDGLIDKFAAETGRECKIVATGGLAPQMIKNCAHQISFEENLILDGLLSIYRRNEG